MHIVSLKKSIIKSSMWWLLSGTCQRQEIDASDLTSKDWDLRVLIPLRKECIKHGAAIRLLSGVLQRCLALLTSNICSWMAWTFCSNASSNSSSSRSWNSLLIINNKADFCWPEVKKTEKDNRFAVSYFCRSSSSVLLLSSWSHSLHFILDAFSPAMFFSKWAICWNQINE